MGPVRLLGLILLFMGLPLFGQTGTISTQEAEEPTLITLHAEDANLPSILAVLARESGYNIVTDPTVNQQDKISIHLDDVPIEQAINLVVRAVGLSYEIVGNSFLIAEPKKLEEEVGITSHVITLKYADALEVQQLLQDLTEQIQVDVSGNKLLINASPKKVAEIEEVVREIDVPATQILLQTRLIEVAVDEVEKLGIDWSKLASYTNIFAENAEPPSPGAGSVVPGPNELGELPDDMPFDRLRWKNIRDQNFIPTKFSRQMTAFDVTLDFLLSENKAEILADSKLVTLNGREAYIKMLDIVPYILSAGGVGGQVQVEREEVGIKLSILPTVNTDGYITVRVEPEVSSIFEFIGPDRNIPRVKSRISSTTIRVKDGESIVIGGLISRDKKETVYKFPVLHRIPFFGKKLFSSTDVLDKRTDLIIEITPSIIKDEYVEILKTEDMIRLERSIEIPEKILEQQTPKETPSEPNKGVDHE
jgi:type II secretory pathway component GspD/PulD (secretin)